MNVTIPKNLLNYFKGEGENGDHLKIMATLHTNKKNGDIAHWGIFFGIRDLKVGDSDGEFKGTIDGKPDKLSWNGEKPLWLIPLTEEANNTAKKIKNGNDIKDEILFDFIIIRNKIANEWEEYDFDILDNIETDLIFEIKSKIKEINTTSGSWMSIKYEGDAKEWCVWMTNKDHHHIPLITIEGTHSEIINNNGGFEAHHITFEIYKNKGNYLPIININNNISTGKKDFPIIWWQNERRDNFILHKDNRKLNPNPNPIYIIIEKTIYNAERFIENPFAVYEYDESVANTFIQNFNKKDTTQINSWIYIEMREGAKYICICYAKWFYFNRFGNKTKAAVFQISRNGNNLLFTKLYNVDSIYQKYKTEVASKIQNGLDYLLGANSVTILPKLPTANISDDFKIINAYEIFNDNKSDSKNISLNESCILDKKDALTNGKPFNSIELPQLISSTKGNIVLNNLETRFSFLENEPNVRLTSDNGTLFRTSIKSFSLKEDYTLVDGSLAFDLSKDTPDDKTTYFGDLYLKLQRISTQTPFYLWEYHNDDSDISLHYSFSHFSLPVKAVNPVGNDLLNSEKYLAPGSLGSIVEGRGERKEQPLIIPLSSGATLVDTNDKPNYLLRFSESTNIGQNYSEDMELIRYNPSTTEINPGILNAVAIDTNPQFVGLVKTQFLEETGTDMNNYLVARKSQFSIEQGAWELLNDTASTKGFNLFMPTQAIGEAYVKNDTPEAGEPIKDLPIEYRFGVPTQINIAYSRLNRRYVTPPWNLRRIWGNAGDVAPGVPLLETQFELLYGLTGSLKPDKAFIAELGAKLGESIPPPVNSIQWSSTSEQENEFRKRYLEYIRFYRAWNARLAVLEPSTDNAFGKSEFKNNLRYSPRINISKVLPYKKIAGADLMYPIKGPSENFGNDAENTELTEKIKAAHSPSGLAGGFHYGFEAEVIYREFWREFFIKNKSSSSAELRDLAFTSLGGYGKQIARFAGDKTVIKSNTTMGRTHFYAVERIGRIGVFWNKAKHVIEYERVVIQPEQFPNQPEHLGRPLVRKVREYVEILEPSRKYPDFGGNASDASGTIRACTFKTKIIPVLGSWGKTVWMDLNDDKKAIGWEIPLWNPNASSEIYPKPQITVEALAALDYDTETTVLNISEPHNLYFYTDTRDVVNDIIIDANVHKWPSVSYVDYTVLPHPKQYDIEPSVGNDHTVMNDSMPDVLDIMPGFERFTFRVDTSDVPVSVTRAYYKESAFNGNIRTATMMRTSPKPKDSFDDFWKVENPEKDPNKPIDPFNRGKDTYNFLTQGKDSLLYKFANGFKNIENDLRKKSTLAVNEIKEYKDDYDTELKNIISTKYSLDRTLNDLVNKLEAKPKIEHLVDLIDDGDAFSLPVKYLWHKSVEGADGLIHRSVAFYDEQTSSFTSQLIKINSNNKNEAIARFKELKARLQSYQVKLDIEINSLIRKIDELNNDMKEGFSSFQNSINSELDAIDKIINKIESVKPVEIKAKTKDIIVDFFTKITSEYDKINALYSKLPDRIKQDTRIIPVKKKIDDLKAAIDKLSKELVNTIDSINTVPPEKLKSDIIVAIRKIDSAIRIEINNLFKTVDSFWQTVDKILREVNTAMDDFWKTTWEKINEPFTEIIEKWENAEDIVLSEVSTAIEKSKQTLIDKLINLAIRPLLGGQNISDISIYSILKILNDWIVGQADRLKNSLFDFLNNNELLGDIDTQFQTLKDEWLSKQKPFKELQEAIESKDPKEILQKSLELANAVNKELGHAAGRAAEVIQKAMKPAASWNQLANAGDNVLNNYRSVYEQFTAPGMGINRKTVAMIVNTDWKNIEERLTLTPMIARAKQFGDDLDALGIRLPIVAITDKLLPARNTWGDFKNSHLGNFNFSNVISDIGGIRLDKLFPGFKMPEFARDNVKVTNGFDKSTMTAWVNAEVDIKLTATQTLMSIGALLVQLQSGVFKARMRVEVDADGKTTKTNSGTLEGSWNTTIGGTDLMTFEQVKVKFNNNKFDFDLDPSRIKMNGLLQVVTDATQGLASTGVLGSPTDENGEQTQIFKVALMKLMDGSYELPVGVKASLNLPAINIGGGTSGITNLTFGGHMFLSVMQELGKFNFQLGLGLYAGKRETPFNIAFFLFGGGGYVSLSFMYEPNKPDNGNGLTMRFEMSIHASVSFAISLGWLNGMLMIAIGMNGTYIKSPRQGDSTSVGFFVMLVGNADIMSIVSVYLVVRLEATYASGSGSAALEGHGLVKLSIKICRFFTLDVSKDYSKTFAGKSGSSRNSVAGGKTVSATTEINYEGEAKKILNTLS